MCKNRNNYDAGKTFCIFQKYMRTQLVKNGKIYITALPVEKKTKQTKISIDSDTPLPF